MKIASFSQAGMVQVGLVDEAAKTVRPIPGMRDMMDCIARCDDMAAIPAGREHIPLASVTLLAPIVTPRRNIFCVGKNYSDHAKEFSRSGFEAGAVTGAELDEFPAVFTKPPSTVVGHGAKVELHSHITQSVDYEAELALIVGRAGRDIRPEDAHRHIFGYAIVNDVTARDRQRNHKQWFLGKALDTFCPMGPWITTADEVDAGNLDVKCWVNGELRQNANTSNLVFKIPELVATLSSGLTLLPGDIIATGTPVGVGIGFNPPKFLKAGDEVTISISGLGSLTNTFG